MTNLEPYYEIKEITPMEGTSVNLAVATPGEVSTFEINPDYINYPDSALAFTATYPKYTANNLKYIYGYADLLPHILRFQVYTNENQVLCDIRDFDVMTKIMGKIKTNLNDLANNSTLEFNGTDRGTILHVNSNFPVRYDGLGLSRYYGQEPKYVFGSSTSHTAGAVNYYYIPLRDLFYTIFNVNEILNFQTKIYVKITWNNSSLLCWHSTSSTSPTTTKTAYANIVAVSGIKLLLKVQKNAELNKMIQKKVESDGIVVEYDNITRLNTTSGGTNLEWKIRIDKTFGNKLKSIVYCLFRGLGTINESYDADCTGVTKLVALESFLNDKQLQHKKLTDDTEFLNMQESYIRNSCIVDARSYFYNFFWKEDMRHFDLSQLCEYTLRVDLTANPLLHYAFIHCSKKILIHRSGLKFID